MAETINYEAGGELFEKLLAFAYKNKFDRMPAGVDRAGLYAAFADPDLVATCFCLFENDLNVCKAAGKLYMHRNTLIYRINKLKKLCGLNACKLSDAVTFMIAYRGYLEEKRGDRG